MGTYKCKNTEVKKNATHATQPHGNASACCVHVCNGQWGTKIPSPVNPSAHPGACKYHVPAFFTQWKRERGDKRHQILHEKEPSESVKVHVQRRLSHLHIPSLRPDRSNLSRHRLLLRHVFYYYFRGGQSDLRAITSGSDTHSMDRKAT